VHSCASQTARFIDLAYQLRMCELVGKNAGPNPSRMLSAAVDNCLSSSLLFCLSKARVGVDDLKASVETVMRRNEKGRWRIASLKVKLHPAIRAEDIPRSKRCLEVFEDFCIVTESVRKGIEVNVDIEMESSDRTQSRGAPGSSR